jgi:hypothetical protein
MLIGNEFIGKKVKLKKDWVTFLAVFLFAGMIVTEVLIVIIMPVILHQQELWARQAALHELIMNRDIANKHWIAWERKENYKNDRGVGDLIKECINDITVFIRTEDMQKSLKLHEIVSLNEDLIKIQEAIYWARRRKFRPWHEQISVKKYIENLKEKCNKSKLKYPYL